MEENKKQEKEIVVLAHLIEEAKKLLATKPSRREFLASINESA
jgi:hypothetical protein